MKLSALSKALALFRELDPDASVQKLQVFLAVAEVGSAGTTHQALIEELDMSKSHVSKTVADLTMLAHDKERGLDLIRSDVDPMNMRYRIIKLTSKGERLAEKLREIP